MADRTSKQVAPNSAYFDITDVKLFVNTAETRSLTRGAERSHISVPAASTRIRNIEDRLGTKLLYRSSRGVALTPGGEAFLRHGRLVLKQLEQLWEDLQEQAHGVRGHLRIFANTTAVTEFLPAILRTYLSSHPHVNVELVEKPSHEIVRAVAEGKTDIGVFSGNDRVNGLQVLPYRQDRLVLAASPAHSLAQCKTLRFEQTVGYDYVALVEGTATHRFLASAADSLQKWLKVRIQVNSYEGLCRMIEANAGIGILPLSVGRRYAKSLKIQLIPLSDDWAMRNLQICVRNLESLPGFEKELIDMLIVDSHKSQ